MGGILAQILNGVGRAAGGAVDPASGSRMREQLQGEQYQGHQNDLNRWITQHAQLTDALERASRTYAGPEGERIRDLQLQVGAQKPGTDLTPFFGKYAQHSTAAQKILQDKAAADAATIKTPPPIPAVTQGSPGTSSNPLASAIAGGSAAQPATNPVSPAAQGGGQSPSAGFPGTSSVSTATAQPVQPVPLAPPSAPAPTPRGLPNPADLLGPSLDAFHSTGYIDPVLEHLLPEQAKVALAQQKLQMIEPYLASLDPQMANFMRMQVLSGGNGMIPGVLGAMEPNAERNVVASSIPKSEWSRLGLDPSLDPNTPLIIEKSKLNPNHVVTARVLSVPQQLRTTDTGGVAPVNTRTGAVGPALEGLAGTGANRIIDSGVDPLTGQKKLVKAGDVLQGNPVEMGVNPGFVPTTKSSTVVTPGQPPVTTTSRSQKGGGTARGGGSIPPVSSGANPAEDHSQTAVNYRAWVDGKANLSEKEQAAARTYADQHRLPLPDTLSAGGQAAIKKIQPILDEIRHAKQLLRERGLDKMSDLESKKALGVAYARYKYLRMYDPLAKVISDLSFDSLRSVGQALEGTGARAFPLFQLGMEHTPVIGLNSDSGKFMMDKLDGMERRAEESLEAAKGMVKSGVIKPPAGASKVEDLRKKYNY